MTKPPFENILSHQESLHYAKILYSRNHHLESLKIVESLLIDKPQDEDILLLQGQHDKALKIYQNILMITADNSHCLLQCGILLRNQNKIEECLKYFHLALQKGEMKAQRELSISLVEYGNQLNKLKDEKALSVYNQAIEIDNSYDQSYFYLGIYYLHRDTHESLKYFQKCLLKNPSNIECLCHMSNIYYLNGQLVESLSCLRQSLYYNNNHVYSKKHISIILNDLGTHYKMNNQLDFSIHCYNEALYYNCSYSDVWYNLGVAYSELNNVHKSIICYELSLFFNPQFYQAHNNLGVLFKDQGNLERSIYHYQTALSLNHEFVQSMNNLAVIYTMLGKMELALQYCIQALALNPRYSDVYNNLGVLYRDEGKVEESIEAYQQCLNINPHSYNASQNLLIALNYLLHYDTNRVSAAHLSWGASYRSFQAKIPSLTPSNSLYYNHQTIRIGYISPDFFTHSVSYFIDNPIRYGMANGRYTIYLYSNVTKNDDKTLMFKELVGNDHYRDIFHQSTVNVCNMIQSDQIDILVELAGHTCGNRLDVMRQKPAPIQVTWIGYPNSTGLTEVDYRFTDQYSDPEFLKQQYAENLYYLSPCFLNYRPYHTLPPINELPSFSMHCVTFGSFNNLSKVNDEVIKVWSSILHRIPFSRIYFKSKPFASTSTKQHIIAKFQKHNIDSSRLDLFPLTTSTYDHLNTYNEIDVSLDPWPYNGTTTTCESLVMGVPVVTIIGSNHSGRVGYSLLKAVGLDEWITESLDEYIETTVNLVSDLKKLNRIRHSLRQKVLDSCLCNGAEFSLELNKAYQTIYQNFQKTQLKE